MKSQNDSDLFLKYYDKSLSPIKNAQAIDLSLFNNEFGVSFLDKASMANSVEARVPMLDHELVEFILGMDENVYYKYNQNKHILKRLIAPYLPTEILNKPKSGFGFKIKKFIPISQMEVEIRASRCYSSSALFNNVYIDQLFNKQDSRKMWCLYIFCKWFDLWDARVGIEL
jgi:asparagine synthase (glutamine-hydrolysing)